MPTIPAQTKSETSSRNNDPSSSGGADSVKHTEVGPISGETHVGTSTVQVDEEEHEMPTIPAQTKSETSSRNNDPSSSETTKGGKSSAAASSDRQVTSPSPQATGEAVASADNSLESTEPGQMTLMTNEEEQEQQEGGSSFLGMGGIGNTLRKSFGGLTTEDDETKIAELAASGSNEPENNSTGEVQNEEQIASA